MVLNDVLYLRRVKLELRKGVINDSLRNRVGSKLKCYVSLHRKEGIKNGRNRRYIIFGRSKAYMIHFMCDKQILNDLPSTNLSFTAFAISGIDANPRSDIMYQVSNSFDSSYRSFPLKFASL